MRLYILFNRTYSYKFGFTSYNASMMLRPIANKITSFLSCHVMSCLELDRRKGSPCRLRYKSIEICWCYCNIHTGWDREWCIFQCFVLEKVENVHKLSSGQQSVWTNYAFMKINWIKSRIHKIISLIQRFLRWHLIDIFCCSNEIC